eukprot:CAMPEP_0194282338 /NCGR_PEP_ID=MMETSP0169-20130528/22944_1 /TAXON_ID=218684 /ORGANISM="Corethron pennatum, Strain L29A3" /LENGTH=694 /DNA_ID=CAMNT_0039027621 /DNA_START=110 /DNA_END=2194 /DNA_ORIENTATION=-
MANLATPSKAPSLRSITDDDSLNDLDSFDILPPGTVSVKAIFGRNKIPRYETLPENYGYSDMASDQIFCRYRYLMAPASDTTALPPGGYDHVAYFLPVRGLVDHPYYNESWPFFHISNYLGGEKYKKKYGMFDDRAVLLQSVDNYRTIASDSDLGKCMEGEDYLSTTTFGEQIIVNGCTPHDLCVGDVFAVENIHGDADCSELVLEISAPRVCDSVVDQRHGFSPPYGPDGLARRCNATGLGGWFARVLVKGTLRDGERLVRTSRPHPQWTLARVSGALYGDPRGDGKASWQGTVEELRELVGLPQLGHYRVKIEAELLLAEMENKVDEILPVVPVAPTDPAAELMVVGLFAKKPRPRIDELPEDYTDADYAKDQVFCRRRIVTKPIDNKGDDCHNDADDAGKYEKVAYIPYRGLVGSTAWHIDNVGYGISEARAILFQSMENYEAIRTHPKLGKYIEEEDDPTKGRGVGEQILVSGCDISRLCVGDVFKIADGLSTLVVEITCPRRSCYHVDLRYGTPKGLTGMKRHTTAHGLGGWFVRVVHEGELRDNMRFVRVSNPHPKWTVPYISKVLYNEGSVVQKAMNTAHWVRGREELEEIVNIPQLAGYEWKDDVKVLLKKMRGGGGNDGSKKNIKEEKGGGQFGVLGLRGIFFGRDERPSARKFVGDDDYKGRGLHGAYNNLIDGVLNTCVCWTY